MGLPRVQKPQDIATLLQLVIQILPVAGRGFHANEDVAEESIQLAQLLLPDLPAFPGIGESDRLDLHSFVRPAHTARTRLAANVNPTDICDRRFLCGGS